MRCSIPLRPLRRRRRISDSAVQEHAELLAKEKRATREAMQKALALQAEAREKIAQSEALLAQYGLADVAPQPTPAPEASKAAPIGEFGL